MNSDQGGGDDSDYRDKVGLLCSSSTGHEKAEEVERDIDGNGGDIMRKEEVEEIVDRKGATVTRTESMQDPDLSGIEAFDSTGPEEVEEVKEIVDGTSGGITRKEEVEEVVNRSGANIKRTESMQDSDLSGTEAFDSAGHEKVEEVKGIVSGNCGGITREESMISEISLQNSDLSGAAAIGITRHEQVDLVEVRHEQVELEEEGIVDKIGGGITRDSMASAASMQNLDLTRTEAIISTRLEEVDFQVVEGILDGNGGGITRRESMDSVALLRNLDLSRTDAIDSTRHEQVDVEEAEGNGCGTSTSESMGSATPMQSSVSQSHTNSHSDTLEQDKGMDTLPDHVVGHVLSLLGDARELIKASLTSRRFRLAVYNHLHSLRFELKDWSGYLNFTSERL